MIRLLLILAGVFAAIAWWRRPRYVPTTPSVTWSVDNEVTWAGSSY